MNPVRVAYGFSVAFESPFSLGVLYYTRPRLLPWPLAKRSHMFVAFEFDNGQRVIHEALLSRGWREKPYAKLEAWHARAPFFHRFDVYWLPIPADVVAQIYKRSCGWVGERKSYAVKQILAFAFINSMVGRCLPLAIRHGPDDVICSEGAGQLVGEASPEWDLRKSPFDAWDNLTPQGARDVYFELREKRGGV